MNDDAIFTKRVFPNPLDVGRGLEPCGDCGANRRSLRGQAVGDGVSERNIKQELEDPATGLLKEWDSVDYYNESSKRAGLHDLIVDSMKRVFETGRVWEMVNAQK